MAYLRRKYYYRDDDIPKGLKALYAGFSILEEHPLFSQLEGTITPKTSHLNGKESIACVTKSGEIFVNKAAGLDANEWAYVLAHNLLHLAFGHFDKDKMPPTAELHPLVWNKACDIYVTRFLADVGFGKALYSDPASEYSIKLNDELKIYEYLLEKEGTLPKQSYGLNTSDTKDMIGAEAPIVYKNGEKNKYAATFSYAITHSMKKAVSDVGGHDFSKKKDTIITKAAEWFLAHYPLLGGLASSFKIIEDINICHRNEIHIAAVDATHGEIYANPSCGLSLEEWKFVLAHEYLHAGLCHHERCQGRDHYLWNVACDYVINDWLHEMKIGDMPDEGLLYDESLHNMSAEAIYDLIVKEMRKFKKHATFRGYGQGDIFGSNGPHFEGIRKGITLDDFFKNSLREGLDYHITHSRGYIPAGLVEEIRALAMPPIPWEVQLGKWFDEQFPPLEKHRTYARPSRRQGSTPDIPRPSYVLQEKALESRTFGVVIDTSGSMCSSQIGLALGAIASYAVSKDVPFVRIIFCDAEATDAGYMAPEDIAGRVEITGRGGTILQPGVDAVEKAKDFPVSGPILIITDGYIEKDLKVKREHAYLIPNGNKLPFRPKGKVFYMENKEPKENIILY
ncbi:MAG TPA: hypothetical protein DDY31_10680 [Lachnospiraceae bacterium]|nr:hypothetical protein [Lachnospiraceae bacterium]